MKKRILGAIAASIIAMGLVACNSTPEKPEDKNVEPSEILAKIKDGYGETKPNIEQIDETILKDAYGINAEDLDSFVAEMPMINIIVDEFFIAKVKEGKMDTVKAACEKRARDLDEQWSQYLPNMHEIVKKHKIIVNGNYIMFAVSEQAENAEKIFNEMTK